MARRHRITPGQSFADAFVEQGVAFPQLAEPEAPIERDKRADFGVRASRRGIFQPGYGWQAVGTPRGRVYRATTDQIGGVFPFLTAAQLPKAGAAIGYVASNGTGFYVDPWQWVQQGLVTNPNLLLQGAPGRGKSALGKSFVRRTLRHGGRAFIPGDLKNEWSEVCREWGQEPWEVGPGMLTRINPLDPGPLGIGWDSLSQSVRDARWQDIRTRWLTLLEGLLGAQNVAVTSTVQQAIAAIVDELTGAASGGGNVHTLPDITIPQVFAKADNPSEAIIEALRYRSRQDYYDSNREMIAGLSVLVNGSLRGMFDGPTTIKVDWDAPIHSLSMRRLKEVSTDQAIGVALTCANSWVSAMTAVNDSGAAMIIPRDEVWRVMRLGVNAIKSLDSNLRLSRDERKIEMLIMHKPGDLSGLGGAGSEESGIASDFWALCDTKISLGHSKTIALETAARWGLSESEALAISDWAYRKKGRALWRVGEHSFRVQNVLTQYEERVLFNTNEMTDYGDGDAA